MCYRAEFGRSALKGVGINIGDPQNLEVLELLSLGIALADPKKHAPPSPYNKSPPHVCTTSNLVFL